MNLAICEFMSVPVNKNHVSKPLSDLSKLKLAHGFRCFGFLSSAMLLHQLRALSGGHSTGSNSPKDDFALSFFSSDEGVSGSGYHLGASQEELYHAAEDSWPHDSHLLEEVSLWRINLNRDCITVRFGQRLYWYQMWTETVLIYQCEKRSSENRRFYC